MLVAAEVRAADVQDRDGAVPLLAAIRKLCPWLRHVFADGGYAGAKLQTALAAYGRWTLQIVKRSDAAKGFELLPVARRLGKAVRVNWDERLRVVGTRV